MTLVVGKKHLALGFAKAGFDHPDEVKSMTPKCVLHIIGRIMISRQFDYSITGAKASLPAARVTVRMEFRHIHVGSVL